MKPWQNAHLHFIGMMFFYLWLICSRQNQQIMNTYPCLTPKKLNSQMMFWFHRMSILLNWKKELIKLLTRLHLIYQIRIYQAPEMSLTPSRKQYQNKKQLVEIVKKIASRFKSIRKVNRFDLSLFIRTLWWTAQSTQNSSSKSDKLKRWHGNFNKKPERLWKPAGLNKPGSLLIKPRVLQENPLKK